MKSTMELVGEIVVDAEMKAAGQAFVKEFYRLQARIAELEADLKNARELIGMTPEPAFPSWISANEPPQEMGAVLTINMGEVSPIPIPASYDPDSKYWSTWFEYDLYVTHWMPLPPRPESPNDTQTQRVGIVGRR